MMVIEQARACLATEAAAIQALIPRVGQSFVDAVNMILSCKGRVIIAGIGKSGLVGKKMAATLASTGTPSFFLHPAEAFHGDLGMVTSHDVVLMISNSGEASEILNILPSIRRIGSLVIAMTGRMTSSLAQNADVILDIGVEQEACPLGLAPTASTTATMAMGDALAVALLSERKFTPEAFALFHPGGALGRKLLLTVGDIMHQGEENPVTLMGKSVKAALFSITAGGLGATTVTDNAGRLVGIITDGDIRRGLEKGNEFLDQPVEALMTKTPRTVTQDKLAAHALNLMETNKPRPITVLPVVDGEGRSIGMIHITDLLRHGVV